MTRTSLEAASAFYGTSPGIRLFRLGLGASQRLWPALAVRAALRLFGTPLLDHILGAYTEAARDADAPLADGWPERVPLHQLFPLLVHTVLFGGGYARQALSAAKAALHAG